MRIIICPDSFKGSLTSAEAADAIERGLRRAFPPGGLEITKVPLADGGEGTVDALVHATGGEIKHVRAHDPLMREIDSFYGLLGARHTAAIEMAAASGLILLAENERSPLVTTTYGTGELILAALESGVEKIIIGIGGSATNDGGAGAMSALGARFLDAEGKELPPGGAALARLAHIDMSGFRFATGRVAVEAACDVDNPLTGPHGASAVYGPQKGATPEMVETLDAALANYAEVIKRDLGKDIAAVPGAGAAGGLGAGLAAFLNADLRSGIDMVLDAVAFDRILTRVDLVITGEGRLDEQTAHGKAIGGILRRALAARVPVIAIAGSVSGEIAGLSAAYSLVSDTVTPDYAMAHAAELLEEKAAQLKTQNS